MNKKTPIVLLVVLYSSAFIAGFNENLVNMALVSIMNEFAIDAIAAQWLVTGYMIVATVAVMCMAFLYRRFQLRQLFFAAAGFSFVGTVMGLFSPTFEFLMVARLVQAVGSGIFIPLMMNTILVVTPKNKLGQFLSIGGCMITFGPAFAPVVCGGVVSALGWRYIFALPAIVLLVISIVAFFAVKNLETSDAKLDFLSVIIATLMLFTLSFGLAEVMVDWKIGVPSLIAFVVVTAWFVIRQFRLENPLINLEPMKSILFWPSILMTSVAMIGTFSCSVLLPQYFEAACGMEAFLAGLLLLVPVLCNCGATLVAGRIMDKHGEWPLLPAGYAVIVAGFILLAIFSSSLSLVLVFIAAIAVFAGTGLIFSPSQTSGLKTLTPEQNPHGVALTTTFVQIAACIGPSLYTGLMTFGQNNSAYVSTNSQLALAEGFGIAMTVAAAIAFIGFADAFIYSLAAKKRYAQPRKAAATEAEEVPVLSKLIETVPWVVNEKASVREAMQLMVEKEIGGLPIVNGKDEVTGFVSDGDIMRYIAEQQGSTFTGPYALLQMANNQTLDQKIKELLGLEVSVIATEKVVTLDEGATLEEACNLLSDSRLKKVPVLSGAKIVGTLNRSAILRYIMEKSLLAEAVK
ncbi:MAG: MFS transporter [Phoenicibacter congonensis]|uniref:MFS transporter n=1 Tax=Phoenicibacter congonensis TaxID=1944646 RepID=A0AA43RHD1_9ACTN|nr:MFS transporter [Phoenicibacter congonensis]